MTTMKKYTLTKIASIALMAIVAGMYVACQPEDFYGDNGLVTPDLAASFTITPVEGKVNTYVLDADNNGVLAFRWDKGDGKMTIGLERDTLVLPDAGTYTIKLEAIGIGGVKAVATKEVVVETSDPVAGNLVIGPKMDNPDAWTKMPINGGAVNFDFVNEMLVASGGSWGHNAIYQPIEVVAGRKYKLDMYVEGSGATDVWFEVYLGTVAPTPNSDYSSGGIQLGLNTWTGCGKTSFAGKLSAIGCVGALKGANKTITFAESGTIYLFIKSGGSNLGTTGISIDNVEFRGVK
jgi:hypothetical protein